MGGEKNGRLRLGSGNRTDIVKIIRILTAFRIIFQNGKLKIYVN